MKKLFFLTITLGFLFVAKSQNAEEIQMMLFGYVEDDYTPKQTGNSLFLEREKEKITACKSGDLDACIYLQKKYGQDRFCDHCYCPGECEKNFITPYDFKIINDGTKDLKIVLFYESITNGLVGINTDTIDVLKSFIKNGHIKADARGSMGRAFYKPYMGASHVKIKNGGVQITFNTFYKVLSSPYKQKTYNTSNLFYRKIMFVQKCNGDWYPEYWSLSQDFDWLNSKQKEGVLKMKEKELEKKKLVFKEIKPYENGFIFTAVDSLGFEVNDTIVNFNKVYNGSNLIQK
jgi:hypothetical protein